MDENPVKPIPEDKHPGGDTEKTAPAENPAVIPVPIGKINAEGKNPTAQTEQAKRKRKPLSRMDIWTIILAIVGILVAAGTGIAIIWQDKIASATLKELQKQYPELQKSSDAAYQQMTLMRQQLVGTQAAVIRIYVSGAASWAADNKSLISAPAFLDVRNDGEVIAPSVVGTFEITRQSLRDNKVLSTPQEVSIDCPPLSPKSGKCQKYFNLVGFSPSDMKQIESLNETVLIQGTATYNNGFGDKVPIKLCSQMIGMYGDDGHSSGVQWLNCDFVPQAISRYRAIWEVQKQKQK